MRPSAAGTTRAASRAGAAGVPPRERVITEYATLPAAPFSRTQRRHSRGVTSPNGWSLQTEGLFAVTQMAIVVRNAKSRRFGSTARLPSVAEQSAARLSLTQVRA